MFVALRRAVAAAPSSLLLGSWRGVKGKVLRKGMWDGWPKYSPDGWPCAADEKLEEADIRAKV